MPDLTVTTAANERSVARLTNPQLRHQPNPLPRLGTSARAVLLPVARDHQAPRQPGRLVTATVMYDDHHAILLLLPRDHRPRGRRIHAAKRHVVPLPGWLAGCPHQRTSRWRYTVLCFHLTSILLPWTRPFVMLGGCHRLLTCPKLRCVGSIRNHPQPTFLVGKGCLSSALAGFDTILMRLHHCPSPTSLPSHQDLHTCSPHILHNISMPNMPGEYYVDKQNQKIVNKAGETWHRAQMTGSCAISTHGIFHGTISHPTEGPTASLLLTFCLFFSLVHSGAAGLAGGLGREHQGKKKELTPEEGCRQDLLEDGDGMKCGWWVTWCAG